MALAMNNMVAQATDWYNWDSIKVAVGTKGAITLSSCEDDLGIFTFDIEKSIVRPDYVEKGKPIKFLIEGDFSEAVYIKNVNFNTFWGGNSLYQVDQLNDKAQEAGSHYEDYYDFDIPSYAFSGSYHQEIKGMTDQN